MKIIGRWTLQDEGTYSCGDVRDVKGRMVRREDGICTMFLPMAGLTAETYDMASRLIESAPDHALYAAALTAGVARWEPFAGRQEIGEVCVDGMRHSANIDDFGVPVLSDHLRKCLKKALGD